MFGDPPSTDSLPELPIPLADSDPPIFNDSSKSRLFFFWNFMILDSVFVCLVARVDNELDQSE